MNGKEVLDFANKNGGGKRKWLTNSIVKKIYSIYSKSRSRNRNRNRKGKQNCKTRKSKK